MERKFYALGLSRGDTFIHRLWSREFIKALLSEEPEDLLEDKEAVLRPLPQRILICGLYYPCAVVLTVASIVFYTALSLIVFAILGLGHLIRQLR